MKKLMNRVRDYFTSIPIHLKIYGMFFIVVFMITIISILVVRVSTTETLAFQLEERVKSIGSDVAARSGDLMLTNNIYALQKLVIDTIQHNKDIEYVFILNENGKVLVHTFGEERPSIKLIQANSVDSLEENNLLFLSTAKGTIRDVAVPVIKGLGGTARVGLRSDSLDEALASITTKMLLTMFAVLSFSIFIVIGLTGMIVQPITKLVDLTKKVAQGDFSSRISQYPKDEIGKLTQSFNIMLADLEKAGEEKEEYYQKIASRNQELILLNSISANITSVNELRDVLQQFVVNLVEELALNSATIRVKIVDHMEMFYYSGEHCSVNDQNFDIKKRVCDCQNEKKKYNKIFSLMLKEIEIGEIYICSVQQLDSYSVKILTSICNQLSVTIENIQLWHEVKKKEKIRLMLLEKIMTVQEEERKRIARELHDETSHSISSILLGLKVLQEASSEEKRENEINRLRDLAHQTLEEVHELAWQLRPSILDKFGLKVALERYIEEFQKKYAVEFDVIITGIEVERLRPDVETAIFRIVQESLTNILKYAKANSISVIIMKSSQMISVIIEDNGVGFRVEEVLTKDPSKYNLGIRGMQERVLLLGGTLNIESEIDEGTAIMVKIPFTNGGRELLEN